VNIDKGITKQTRQTVNFSTLNGRYWCLWGYAWTQSAYYVCSRDH